jgi:hypothetical protein
LFCTLELREKILLRSSGRIENPNGYGGAGLIRVKEVRVGFDVPKQFQ